MTTELEGPYLVAALLCEKVLEEKDGVLSIIRIVDRFYITVQGPDAPEKMPPMPVNVTGLVSFKSGFARGSNKVILKLLTPSRQKLPEVSLPILFEGDDNRGNNLVLPISFVANEEGLYWFEVCLGERLITRMPLQVVYQRISRGIR